MHRWLNKRKLRKLCTNISLISIKKSLVKCYQTEFTGIYNYTPPHQVEWVSQSEAALRGCPLLVLRRGILPTPVGIAGLLLLQLQFWGTYMNKKQTQKCQNGVSWLLRSLAGLPFLSIFRLCLFCT